MDCGGVRLRRAGGVRRAMHLAVASLAPLLFAAVPPAAAEPPSDPSLQQLASIYGVTDEPAEILAVVDTSDSMVTDGNPPPWPQVVTGYRALIDGASEYDEPALITFSEVANIRWRPVPLSSPAVRAEAKAALPTKKPRGLATDIGAGLQAAVDLLQAAGSPRIQTMVFITDGKNVPPSGSPFRAKDGPAWARLRQSAKRLQAAHGDDLSVYAYGLGPSGSTDVGLVASVFPNTEIVSFPASQVADFIRDLTAESMRARVRPEVAADLSKPITAGLTLGPLAPETDGTLTLTNPRKGLPATVDVRSVQLTDSDGRAVPADITPTTLTIGPGEQQKVPVVVHPTDADHGFSIGEKEDARDWHVTVDASASIPAQLAKLLETEQLAASREQLAGAVQNVTPTVRASGSYGIAPWKIVLGVLLALVIVVALVRFGYWLFVPPQLRGSLETLDGDGEYRIVRRLSGTEFLFPGTALELGETPDRVRLFTKPRKRPGKVYAQKVAGAPRLRGEALPLHAQLLAGGVVFQVGHASVRYSTASGKRKRTS